MRHISVWDFEIQTDHVIPIRRRDIVIFIKRKRNENLPCRGLCHRSGLQSENQRRRKEIQVLGSYQMVVVLILTVIGAFVEHLNCSIAEIGSNIKKSPGGLRKVAVTRIRVKDYQVTLIWWTCKEKHITYNNSLVAFAIPANPSVNRPPKTKKRRDKEVLGSCRITKKKIGRK